MTMPRSPVALTLPENVAAALADRLPGTRLISNSRASATSPPHRGMIIDVCPGPSRPQRSRREAAEKAGEPKAHATFVGQRGLRHRDHGAEKYRCKGCHKHASRTGWLFHVRPLRSIYRYPPAGRVRV